MVAQEARERHEREVHLIDAIAIRRALLGDPVALTELERGAAIVLCDTHGMSREVVAEGLGTYRRQLERDLAARRRDLPAARAQFLTVAARRPALDLVEAVQAWDRDAVAAVFDGLDRDEMTALAVVLAAFAGGVRDPRSGIDMEGDGDDRR